MIEKVDYTVRKQGQHNFILFKRYKNMYLYRRKDPFYSFFKKKYQNKIQTLVFNINIDFSGRSEL